MNSPISLKRQVSPSLSLSPPHRSVLTCVGRWVSPRKKPDSAPIPGRAEFGFLPPTGKRYLSKSEIGIKIRPDPKPFPPHSEFAFGEERSFRIALPAELADRHVQIGARNAELLGRLMSEKRPAMTEVVNLVDSGKSDQAAALAKEIGLDEENFASRGGGNAGAVLVAVAVVAAIALWASNTE